VAATLQNPYAVLGIKPTASEQQIQSAYRELAARSHPSLRPGDEKALARYREISAAYRLLADKEQRDRFDREAAASGGLKGSEHGGGPYTTAPRYDSPPILDWDAGRGKFVIRPRPLGVVAIALWIMLSFGYGIFRGFSTDLDGVVVSRARIAAPLDQFLMLWHWRSVNQYVIRDTGGREQTFVQGPVCSLFSGTLPRPGAHIHKEAWRGDYELDGRRVSEMTPLCALYFPLRLIFALGLLTIGIMDWAMARDARR
jgi:curved DNA-binding protein CbpA